VGRVGSNFCNGVILLDIFGIFEQKSKLDFIEDEAALEVRWLQAFD
jgi:hypothetical protein